MKRPVIFLIMCAAALSGCENNREYSQTIFAMDTVMELTAYGKNGEDGVLAAIEEINRLDGILDANDRESAIFKLNNKKEIKGEEDIYRLIKDSVAFGEETGGLLNIGLYPIIKEWGFNSGEYKIPQKERLEELLKHTGLKNINFNSDDFGVEICDEYEEIELGAVAKGYTGDRVIEIFKENGVERGIISLGGNVQTLGAKADGSPWKVAVANPDEGGGSVGIVEVTDKAVVTSGSYQRYFEKDGKRYHHIIDPRTGMSAQSGLKSVTIISALGEMADAYSTAVFIMGEEQGAEFWRRRKDEFDMILITGDDRILITKPLENSFTSTGKNSKVEIIE